MYINSVSRYLSYFKFIVKSEAFHGLLFNSISNHLFFLVKCQKVSSTGFLGHYAQVDVGRDETACVESCQDDKECVAASIGSRGRPCYLYKAGYGEQTSGRGRRGWTSYTCCRGRGCPRG